MDGPERRPEEKAFRASLAVYSDVALDGKAREDLSGLLAVGGHQLLFFNENYMRHAFFCSFGPFRSHRHDRVRRGTNAAVRSRRFAGKFSTFPRLWPLTERHIHFRIDF